MSLRVFGAIDLSSTGLSGQRARMQTVSENIANSQVTRTADGGPYRRKQVVMESADKDRRETRIEATELESAFAQHLAAAEQTSCTSEPFSTTQSWPVMPISSTPSSTYRLISCARNITASMSGSSIEGK